MLSAGLDPASQNLPPLEGLFETRFVYIDASLRGSRVELSRNATGLSFADDKAGYLAGYLSALMAARRAQFRHGRPVVSVVGGPPSPPVNALVRGFARGARTARPGIAVVIDRTSSITDQAVCERIANRQIDHGSTVVFAAAGTCGFGALSAANLRGVWGVGSDADRSYLGSHILASTVKRIDRAVELAVRWFLQGALPQATFCWVSTTTRSGSAASVAMSPRTSAGRSRPLPRRLERPKRHPRRPTASDPCN